MALARWVVYTATNCSITSAVVITVAAVTVAIAAVAAVTAVAVATTVVTIVALGTTRYTARGEVRAAARITVRGRGRGRGGETVVAQVPIAVLRYG